MMGLETTRKSVDGPCDEARAIIQAAEAAQVFPMPVVHRRRVLGWVRDVDGEAYYLPVSAAISSYEDLIASLTAGDSFKVNWSKINTASAQNNSWFDMWPTPGVFLAGTMTGTAKTARQFDDSTQGAILHGGDVSPDEKFLRYTFGAVRGYVNQPGNLVVYDRVLSYDQCTRGTVDVANNMTNTLAAQRYCATGEPGLQVMMVAYSSSGAAGSCRFSYTNQGGTSGRTSATETVFAHSNPGFIAGPIADIINTNVETPFWPLQAGDCGVRSIETYTHVTVSNYGAASSAAFVLVYPICIIPNSMGGMDVIVDHVQGFRAMPRIYDGACLSILMQQPVSGVRPYCLGEFNFSWG